MKYQVRVGEQIRASILKVLLVVFACGTTEAIVAQSPGQVSISPTPYARPLEMDRGSAALWQLLLKLHTRASLINIVGHPDDEAGAMLTYEGRGHGVRTSLLQMNRGEGGQNAMSNDYYDELGLDRTEELLTSDRYYGTVQHFVMVPDLGFSKTKEEALSLWTHERVLGDVVRTIRMERPLVITSENVGGPTDGHGHHQVAGETAQEAFKAAGDPNAFPDQIREGLLPWTPLKMYARVPSPKPNGIFDQGTGKYLPVRFQDYINNTWIEGIPSVNVTVPTGTYDPLLGGYYTQISREGLGYQKTQGQGSSLVLPQPTATSYHRFGSLVQSADKESNFFDGIDVSLMGIADLAKGGDAAFLRDALEKVNANVEQALAKFSAVHPEEVAPLLASGLTETVDLMNRVKSSDLDAKAKYDILHELAVKQTQFNNALVGSLGLSLNADAAAGASPVQNTNPAAGPMENEGSSSPAAASLFSFATPGQQFIVRVHVANQGPKEVKLDKVWLEGPEQEKWSLTLDGKLPTGTMNGDSTIDQKFSVGVPTDAKPTVPYFTRQSIEQPFYGVSDVRYRTLPFNPYPLSAWAEVDFSGAKILLSQYVQRPKREQGVGSVMEPVEVVPLISVAISPKAGITPLNEKEFKLDVKVKSEVDGPAQGSVKLNMPPGWRSIPMTAPFSTTLDGEEQTLSFQVLPSTPSEKNYVVSAIATYAGHEYKSGFVTTGYPGLQSHNSYSEATYRTSGVDVHIAPGLKVGYIEGTGDDVAQSLENLGIKPEFISSQDLASGNLQKFDAIILGVRAYSVRPELAVYNERLLSYVRNGGVAIVQYQAAQYDHHYGPYPLELGRAERVVVENGESQILNPKSPVLSWPNLITSKDLDGWVEERGHGFLAKWDSKYEAPIEMHDPGQGPQEGGLVFARYGKGAYVYTAFALYRQLPEGVAGAYRITANLLSLAKNPQLTGNGGQKSAK